MRQAFRVGHETIVGHVAGGFRTWVEAGLPIESTGRLTVDELAGALGGDPDDAPFVLDVRQASEYEAGHVHGARHLTAGTLRDELETLPRDKPIAVMCASGYRSSVAASLLDQAGFEHVSWVADGVPAWRAAGYDLEYGGQGAPDASAASTTRLGVEEPAGPHRH